MGRDKALLPWGTSTLLDHALARLREACPEVRILCGPETRYTDRGVPVQADLRPGAGPLAGLEAGLLQVQPEAVGLFLGVDLPFVTAALLSGLLQRSEGFDTVVPVWAGLPQPLCAVYRATCLGPVQQRLESGELKMTSFWPDVRVREVRERELRAYGDPAALLRNLNTPEEYERARLQW